MPLRFEKRVRFGFAISVCAVLLLAAAAIVTVRLIVLSNDQLKSGEFDRLVTAGELESAAERSIADAQANLSYLNDGTPPAGSSDARRRFLELLTILKMKVDSPLLQTRLAEIERAEAAFNAIFETLQTRRAKVGSVRGIELELFSELEPRVRAFRSAFTNYFQAEQDVYAESLGVMKQATRRAFLYLSVVTGLAIFVVFTVFIFLVPSIIRIFRQAVERERQTRFLHEAGMILGSSLDFEETLRRVAQLAIPLLADIAVVDIIEEKGKIRRFAVEVSDSKLSDIAALLRISLPQAHSNIAEVMHTKTSILRASIEPEYLKAHADDELVAGMRDVGATSFMIVPMVLQGRLLGTITLLYALGSRHYRETDLSWAEQLASMAAAALDHARLFDEARRAVSVRDEFLSVASHEIKTPLTSMQLQLGILAHALETRSFISFTKEREIAAVQDTLLQMERLVKMVNELLDVSHIDSGRFTITAAPCDLVKLVRGQCSLYAHQAALFGSSITTTAPEQLVGLWDAQHIEQVVANLIGNALKYGRGEPISVAVREHAGQAQIVVSDMGIGIDAEKLEVIFSRYGRAVEGKAYAGLGLGLYISEQIVQSHGGRIEVVSKPGAGSTFTVSLPFQPVAVEAPDSQPA